MEKRSGSVTRWKHVDKIRHDYKTDQNGQEKTVAVGDLEVIKEDNIPSLQWPLGRIVTVHAEKESSTSGLQQENAREQLIVWRSYHKTLKGHPKK